MTIQYSGISKSTNPGENEVGIMVVVGGNPLFLWPVLLLVFHL